MHNIHDVIKIYLYLKQHIVDLESLIDNIATTICFMDEKILDENTSS